MLGICPGASTGGQPASPHPRPAIPATQPGGGGGGTWGGGGGGGEEAKAQLYSTAQSGLQNVQ